MELTPHPVRSRLRPRPVGAAAVVALSCASVLSACNTADPQEPPSANESTSTTQAANAIPSTDLGESVRASDEDVEAQSMSTQASNEGEGGDTEPDDSATARDFGEPEDSEFDDADATSAIDSADGDATQADDQRDGAPDDAEASDSGSDSTDEDSAEEPSEAEPEADTAEEPSEADADAEIESTDEATEADADAETEPANDDDESPTAAVDDRPQILRLAAPTLSGEVFDVAPLAGRDVLLWFWSPL